MSYQDKYLKYKNKYLELKSIVQSGGAQPVAPPSGPEPEVPPPAKVGDHIQDKSGEYLGRIMKTVEDRFILNTGLYVAIAEQNIYWIPINLPDEVKILDIRPNSNNIENGPWLKVAHAVPRRYDGSFDLGNYVVGKNGKYWGRIYGKSGDSLKLIDGNPFPGRTAKMRNVYNNSFRNPMTWYELKFPPGVSLEDSRRPASYYLRAGDVLPEPAPFPPPLLLVPTNSDLPRPQTARIDSYIMCRSGLYLGRVVEILNSKIYLNIGTYLRSDQEGHYYFAINLPKDVRIYDNRDRFNWRLTDQPVRGLNYDTNDVLNEGDHVVGKDGNYLGRTYAQTLNMEDWYLIDGYIPPGKMVKKDEMYNSRSTNTDSYKWFRLVFPASVHLADDRTEDLRQDTWRNHIYQPVYPGPSAAELAQAATAQAAAVQAATAQAAREAAATSAEAYFARMRLEKQRIIDETNNAIAADTTVPDNIDLNSKGCDLITTGCASGDNVTANFNLPIQDFMNEQENVNNTIVFKIIDTPTTSRIFLINRANLQTVLTDSTVYPCLRANNIPGRDSNVITELPLYSLANIVGTRVLIKRDTLDTFLQIPGNLFFVVSRHIYSYPSIASHNVIFNQGSYLGGLHCNSGSLPETLWNIKRVNL